MEEGVRVVVLTGSGGAFSSGADLRAEEGSASGEDILEEGFNATIRALWNLPKPVLAAVDGVAVGFGLSLSLACDIRLVSEDARFSPIFVRIGLTLDGGASYFLPRLVGLRAMELAMTGEFIGAQEALRLGLVNRVFPSARFRQEVEKYAENLAQGPPLALAAIKASVHKAFESSLEGVLTYEMAEQRRLSRTEDFREGLRAFLQRRQPVYKGK